MPAGMEEGETESCKCFMSPIWRLTWNNTMNLKRAANLGFECPLCKNYLDTIGKKVRMSEPQLL